MKLRRKPSLSNWWLDRLTEETVKHFPEVVGDPPTTKHLVDCWKVDGWNDGTATLHGMYLCGQDYVLCSFPDYGEPEKRYVFPVFEHTGWN